ncbi:serine hydrolase domain-containing protein [Patulibacter minatonensis]|uniref:serine hydrolase domain-containing protein n=1 Tax=Patulibacter minatonensis TaxID=298163 RepID=UPI0006843674|nr:serine hydrolase [Patulibacter minatonensis]
MVGRRVLRTLATTGAAAVLLALTASAAPAASPAPGMRCAPPTGAAELPARSPAALGLDEGGLRRAIDAATAKAGGSVAVYRYGCLAASSHSEGPDRGYQSWSASKSVVSMAVSRAIELGLLSMDDTVGSLVPEADAPHGAITVRQLLQQNSGLHQHLVRDYNFILDDHLQNALTLPFDHAPGTHFTYGQVTVSLLAEVVGRAAGEDYQAFLRRELLAPLGIPGDAAAIHRDRAGRTDGYMGIEMPTRYWARLGQLLLQDGRWGGRQLLDEDWMAQVGRSSPTNACYSLLFWPDAPGCAPRWAPADGYEMNGLGEQIVWVVPSQGLVVVRFGTMTGGVKDPLKEGVTKAVVAPRPVPLRPEEPEDGEPALDPDAAFRTILDLRDVLAVAGVQLAQLPGRGPARARALQLPDRALAARPDGDVVVPVACPPVARVACAGRLRATTVTGDATLSSATFRVAAGGRGTVRLGSAALDRVLAGTAKARRGARSGATTRAVTTRITLRSRTDDAAGGVPTARSVDVRGPVRRTTAARRKHATRR